MRVAIISNYALIREGLSSIISKIKVAEIKFVAETLKDVMIAIKKDTVDIIIIDLHENNSDELYLIEDMKDEGIKSKVLICDFNKNKDLFIKSIKCGVEGYILAKSNEEEIIHIINQINEGKKYFDAYFIDSMINRNSIAPEGITQLTIREKEILCEIGKGLSNRNISEKFFISEHTVKKHIKHIFDKLNMRDRTQVALYANRCGIIDNNAS